MFVASGLLLLMFSLCASTDTMDRFDFVHLMSVESVPQRQRAGRFRRWWSGAVAPSCFSTRFCAATTSGQQQFEDS